MLGQGADVMIILAQDTTVIGPAVQAAKDAGVPVIAYDRLIEDPDVLYVTFDNVGVGKLQAEAIIGQVPKGNYVLIKGDPGDPNASTFLPGGWDQAGLKEKVDSGDIVILNGPAGGSGTWPTDYGTYTDAWATETAQANMEAIIDKAVADGTPINAVLAENDSTALGVAAALTGKNYDPYPPVSGQDGDPANLNNVAKGLQYVDVWKQANELGKATGAAALALCAGGEIASLTLEEGLVNPEVAPVAGLTATPFETPGGNTVSSFILQPTPLTAENLQLAIDGGQITKDALCAGVDPASAPPACQ
jgi:D-xylose transport system substrate-binding protein